MQEEGAKTPTRPPPDCGTAPALSRTRGLAALRTPLFMGSPPLMFYHPAAYAARGRIFLHQRGEPRTPETVPQADTAAFICLRRGLRLKDGPGSARAATVSAWLGGVHPLAIGQDRPSRLRPRAKLGQTVGCSTFTRGAEPATRRVADGERMNHLRKVGAFAPMAGRRLSITCESRMDVRLGVSDIHIKVFRHILVSFIFQVAPGLLFLLSRCGALTG